MTERRLRLTKRGQQVMADATTRRLETFDTSLDEIYENIQKVSQNPDLLTEKQLVALRLWYKGDTYEEIGKALGFSHQRANNIVYSALRRLNKHKKLGE